ALSQARGGVPASLAPMGNLGPARSEDIPAALNLKHARMRGLIGAETSSTHYVSSRPSPPVTRDVPAVPAASRVHLESVGDSEFSSMRVPMPRAAGSNVGSAALAAIDQKLDMQLGSDNFQRKWAALDEEALSDPLLVAIGKIFLTTPT